MSSFEDWRKQEIVKIKSDIEYYEKKLQECKHKLMIYEVTKNEI